MKPLQHIRDVAGDRTAVGDSKQHIRQLMNRGHVDSGSHYFGGGVEDPGSALRVGSPTNADGKRARNKVTRSKWVQNG